MSSLENFVVEVIEGRRGAFFTKSILYALSCLYRGASFLHRASYQLRRPFQSQAYVISIGNIVAGGTGKSPLVRLLAEHLSKKGEVAILSRGYRAANKKNIHFRVSSHTAVEECGDEPFWLAKCLPQVSVWVGKKRAASALLAIENGAKYLILDDGMQHLGIGRDIEIVVMDGKDLFGKGYFLPRGYLRESPKILKNADLIVVNHIGDSEHWELCRKAIQRYSDAPIVGMQMQALEHKVREGASVGAFCGIAKPQRFLETLQAVPLQVKEQLFALDHMPFKKEALEAFSQACQAKGIEALVCTEKDFVKLPKDLILPLPVYPLEAELIIVKGEEHWKELIEKIQQKK